MPFGRGDRSVIGEAYEFVYPDGPRDAEALAVDPGTGRLHLVSKGVFGGTVYRAPKHLDAEGPNELEAVAEAPGLVTDAAWTPDGTRLLVRNYGQLVALAAPGFEEAGRMILPAQQQGEGLAVDPTGEIFVSSEGVDSDVLRILLPDELAAALAGSADAEDDASASDEGAGTTTDAPEGTSVGDEPERWPWLVGTGVGVIALVVLIRSLRPR
ncbi:hypothetical protein [Nocardioides alcanivorans]|uniref:hypothetical protein n=1 Tax=Nocardioides alcanivorans TaxID=2897352 RepID=UPI001F47E4B8|nr:hypothetical protein [Nocardioides alcanivorans]